MQLYRTWMYISTTQNSKYQHELKKTWWMLQINDLVGHYCARWPRAVTTPVTIEKEASIEYLTPWLECSSAFVWRDDWRYRLTVRRYFALNTATLQTCHLATMMRHCRQIVDGFGSSQLSVIKGTSRSTSCPWLSYVIVSITLTFALAYPCTVTNRVSNTHGNPGNLLELFFLLEIYKVSWKLSGLVCEFAHLLLILVTILVFHSVSVQNISQ